jgi:hypothetical protein
MVWFGKLDCPIWQHCELVSASVLVSAFTSRTMSYPAATSSDFLSASCFTSPLIEDMLPDPDCSLVDRQRIRHSVLLTCPTALGLLLLSRKSDHLIFLSQSPAVLLVADISIAVVSCIVTSVAKTLGMS